ncbi:MAG: hypothetical protein ABIQ02_13090 [Saprospiraceae bacterium]
MKLFITSLLCITLLLTISCKKDECTPGNLDTNIIGSWNVTSVAGDLGTVEFHANGTLVDSNNALIAAESMGQLLSEKTFMVPSNTTVHIHASNTSGTTSINNDYSVTSYTCNQIFVSLQGFNVILTRN